MKVVNWHLNEWPTPVVGEKPIFYGYITLTDGSVCAVVADSLEAFNDTMATCVRSLGEKL